VPIIGSGFFSVGSILLFNSVLNYLPDAYPEYAASVLAGNDLFRSSFGAGFPLFATAMFDRLGVAWASSLLGFLSILFIPIPFVLYRVSLSGSFSLCGMSLTSRHSMAKRLDGTTASMRERTFEMACCTKISSISYYISGTVLKRVFADHRPQKTVRKVHELLPMGSKSAFVVNSPRASSPVRYVPEPQRLLLAQATSCGSLHNDS